MSNWSKSITLPFEHANKESKFGTFVNNIMYIDLNPFIFLNLIYVRVKAALIEAFLINPKDVN